MGVACGDSDARTRVWPEPDRFARHAAGRKHGMGSGTRSSYVGFRQRDLAYWPIGGAVALSRTPVGDV